MNVAIVVHNYDRQEGTGGYSVELVTRFARAHEVTLYAAGVHAPVPDGVRLVRVPAVRSHGYATILTFPAAFATVRRRHDIVHAQGWVTGRADVVTAHLVLAAWRDAAAGAGGPSGRGERLFGRFVARREATLYRHGARLIIAPSDKVRHELASWYGRHEHVHVIRHAFPAAPPAIDRRAARSQLGLPQDTFLALYAGDARKGLHLAVEAVARSAATHLVVVSHTLNRPYLALAEQRGVLRRIHWIGPANEMDRVYGACDVLFHPTIYDAFALVVAEAMAAGLPPIVSSEAGITELLRHEQSGWILGGLSVQEGATALDRLAGDPDLYARLAGGARRVAGSRSWDDVARETMDVYECVRTARER